MVRDESRINQVAFAISIGIHALLLFFWLPTQKIHVNVDAEAYHIPVQFRVGEKVPEPKPAATHKTEEFHIGTAKASALPKLGKKGKTKVEASATIEEPTSLPGDRETAELNDPSPMTPVYPKEALNSNWEGDVTLLVTVGTNGSVITCKVLKGSGHSQLDESLMRTVKAYWKFKPRRILGQDVISDIQVTYTFSLKE